MRTDNPMTPCCVCGKEFPTVMFSAVTKNGIIYFYCKEHGISKVVGTSKEKK